jgi:hypothetical protein
MIRTVVTGAAALAALLACFGPAGSALAQGPQSMPGSYMNSAGGPGMYSDEFAGGWSGGMGSCGCDDGSGSSCDIGCGDECGYGSDSRSSWLNCCGMSGVSPRWYFIGDYLYVRASFSEAIAYLEQDDNLPNPTDTFHELNFQHESSYRLGGGVKLGCCDEEIRFMFTRLSSYAQDFAPNGVTVPYEAGNEGGGTVINADVDVKSFDLDYRKTIPLGGPACCECSDCCDPCGDPCGCSDACCEPVCPAWDLTFSGGVRFADVNWYRNYNGLDEDFESARNATSTLSFDGGGPRFGLEGRRYFGQQRWCSAYVKGDISLLLGQMHQQIQRIDQNQFVTTQTAQGRRIIPVTEIEAGITTQLTRTAFISAGYLFSAWHDLGFRDQFDFASVTLLEDQYDDANILGFDGFFARVEFGW